MKQITFILIISLLTIISFGQETKLVEIKLNGKISERYYVLKSDGKTKHGEYTSYFPIYDSNLRDKKKGDNIENSFIKEHGIYKLGKKDGPWSERYPPNRKYSGGAQYTYYGELKSEGYFDKDKKVGVWTTFTSDADIRFDYDKNIKLKPILKFITPNYPDSAMEKGVQGVVKVKYNTHPDCSITDITIIQSLSPECDNAVIECIKKMIVLYKKYDYNCEEKLDTMKYNFKLTE